MGRAPFVLLFVFLALIAAAAAPASADHVDLSEMEPFAPYGSIDAVETPKFDDVEYVLPGENVTGVVINGDARAYPIKVLVHHELVNDVVGGVPILVTYCPLCGVSLVFERTIGGQVLFLNVSGLLYRNNLVMEDNLTRSLWPQILGQGANGTYHGTRLVLRTSTRTTWGEWKSLHPDTKLLARPVRPVCYPWGCIDPGFSYDVDPYETNYDNYYRNSSTFQERVFPDDLMHPKTFVLGLRLGDHAIAYPFRDLARERVINDIVGSVPVAVVFSNASSSAKAFFRGETVFAPGPNETFVGSNGNTYDARTGTGAAGALEEIAAFWGFWFAWKDLNPATCVYGIGCPPPSSADATLYVVAGVGAGGLVAAAAYLRIRRRSARRK